MSSDTISHILFDGRYKVALVGRGRLFIKFGLKLSKNAKYSKVEYSRVEQSRVQ